MFYSLKGREGQQVRKKKRHAQHCLWQISPKQTQQQEKGEDMQSTNVFDDKRHSCSLRDEENKYNNSLFLGRRRPTVTTCSNQASPTQAAACNSPPTSSQHLKYQIFHITVGFHHNSRSTNTIAALYQQTTLQQQQENRSRQQHISNNPVAAQHVHASSNTASSHS